MEVTSLDVYQSYGYSTCIRVVLQPCTRDKHVHDGTFVEITVLTSRIRRYGYFLIRHCYIIVKTDIDSQHRFGLWLVGVHERYQICNLNRWPSSMTHTCMLISGKKIKSCEWLASSTDATQSETLVAENNCWLTWILTQLLLGFKELKSPRNISLIYIIQSVNIGSGNALVPSGNKPFPDPMLTEIHNAIYAIWRH